MEVVVVEDDVVGRQPSGARVFALLGLGGNRGVRERGLIAHGLRTPEGEIRLIFTLEFYRLADPEAKSKPSRRSFGLCRHRSHSVARLSPKGLAGACKAR